jgi:hypothetical protein
MKREYAIYAAEYEVRHKKFQEQYGYLYDRLEYQPNWKVNHTKNIQLQLRWRKVLKRK